MKPLFLKLILISFFIFPVSVLADLQGTSYKMDLNPAAAGGAYSVTSASYKAEENTLDWSSKSNLTGTSYKVDGKIGFSDAKPIAMIQSITPGNLSKFYADETPSFTIQATDGDGDLLQYQAKQDGTLKAGPQTSNALSWTISSANKGRRSVDLQVIDPDATVSKNQAMYVLRRPVK